MIFGTPITWLLAEVVALVLFFICMAHACGQKNPTQKVLEFFGFVIASSIFENIGVYTKVYSYDLHRLIMVGQVPLEIVLIEASIVYVALILVDYLRLPGWAKPFAVGLFGSVQDMTLDFAAIFDLHQFDGVMSGQWNWAFRYNDSFFGVPFYNFTGWFVMMAYYAALIVIGRWLYEKYNNKGWGISYPFLAGILTVVCLVSPLTTFLLFCMPFFEMFTRVPELIMMIICLSIPVILLFIFRNRMAAIDFKKDGIAFLIPIALHIYDVILTFALNIQAAYIPVIVFSAIHLLYFLYLYLKSRKLSAADIKKPVAATT